MKMRLYHFLLFILTLGNFLHTTYAKEQRPCELSVASNWKELDTSKKFSSKWVMVGTLSIKKRMEGTLRLESMLFAWKGPSPLPNLSGNLFHIPYNKTTVIPTDEYLVARGAWSVKNQRLEFRFIHPEYIHDPIARYALVLTVEAALEPLLKQGAFEIIADKLPQELRTSVGTQSSINIR